jgi:rubrerythrin
MSKVQMFEHFTSLMGQQSDIYRKEFDRMWNVIEHQQQTLYNQNVFALALSQLLISRSQGEEGVVLDSIGGITDKNLEDAITACANALTERRAKMKKEAEEAAKAVEEADDAAAAVTEIQEGDVFPDDAKMFEG